MKTAVVFVFVCAWALTYFPLDSVALLGVCYFVMMVAVVVAMPDSSAMPVQLPLLAGLSEIFVPGSIVVPSALSLIALYAILEEPEWARRKAAG